MKQRKKPDLRLNIPSYPSDYVEMPPETRKKIEEAIRKSTPSINDDPTPGTSYSDENREGTRTPEIRILGPEDESKSDENNKKSAEEGSVIYRNKGSISVPNDMKNLDGEKKISINIPEHHQSSASGFSDGDNTADDHTEVLSDDERVKSPLRSPRRKSGAPRRLGRSEFSMDDDDYSPSNSVTSVNSLASLLREKLQSIPQKIRKKPADYKLRAFVGLMFLAVAFFVGFAYVLYHQQALTKAYFDNVQFNEPKRMIRIYNNDDVEILRVNLAVNIHGKTKAYPCLPEHRRNDGSECLEWLHTLRFYVKSQPHDPAADNTTCYAVHWQALRDDIHPNDCFDWGDTKVNWYGGGLSLNVSWPINYGFMDYTPFITGDIEKGQWSNALTRYFINSKGAAIIIDDDTPLHIAINKDGKHFCLKSMYHDFAYPNRRTEFPEMKYNICTSADMTTLHSSLHSHRTAPLWDGLKPNDMQTLDFLISEPVWEIAPRFKHELTADTISNYTDAVGKFGFLKQGHILINEHWQNEIGDFTVEKSRFTNWNKTWSKLHRRGFKIVFSLQPFISTESKSFSECVQKRLLISERNSDRRIPALTRFKSLPSAGVLDITNNKSIPWLLDKLQMVMDEYFVDSFFLDLGTAYDMPYYFRCEKSLKNPDEYMKIFTETFEKSLNIVGVSSAVTLPRPPIFVAMPRLESTWGALRTVIPTMLTYGINGFPFIMPGAVGGDIYWPGSEQYLPSAKGLLEPTNTTEANGVELPEKELYMRWLQLAVFLPVVKFTHLPSKYNDKEILEMAKTLIKMRHDKVTPLLLKYKREALEEGLPLIRPLWLVSGSDTAPMPLQDEFVIGNDIVVAPVLHRGHTSRDVYLPSGVWKDGIDGSHRKGNRWMHEYKVPIDKVAHFVRQPDDTRF